MDAIGSVALKKIQRVKDAMFESLEAGAQEYANGGNRAKPIVDGHFTAGNDMRYGWPPLTRAYFLRKAAGLAGKVKGGVAKLAHGRGVKLDKHASFQSSTGVMTGIGQGANLPMLVLTNKLHTQVTSGHAAVLVNRTTGVVKITFRNLEEYALAHHKGLGHMPKRSPVEPNATDRQEIISAMRRYLKKNLTFATVT